MRKRARRSTKPYACFVVFVAVFEGAGVAYTSRSDGPGIFFGFGEGEEPFSEREEGPDILSGNGMVFD